MKCFFFGIDGLSFEDFCRFSELGIFRNLSVFSAKPLHSSIPDVSIVSWTSFFTGKTPDNHGIYGFNHINPVSYETYYPTFERVLPPYIWDECPPSLVFNLPATYPVKAINGTMVSGFVTPNPKKGVYPPEILRIVDDIDYKFDVDPEKGKTNRVELVRETIQNLRKRIDLFWYLLKINNYNTIIFVETGWDRICHFCYDSIKSEDVFFNGLISDYLETLDSFFSNLLNIFGETFSFFLLSDHGFLPSKKEVFVNSILREGGFLKSPSLKELTPEDKAFSLDPGRIYIHDERFSNGRIPVEEKEELVERITEFLKDFEGFFKAYPSPMVYKNYDPYNPDMPDIILLEEKGTILRSWMKVTELLKEPELPGTHFYTNGVFGCLNRDLEVFSIDRIYTSIYNEGVSILSQTY